MHLLYAVRIKFLVQEHLKVKQMVFFKNLVLTEHVCTISMLEWGWKHSVFVSSFVMIWTFSHMHTNTHDLDWEHKAKKAKTHGKLTVLLLCIITTYIFVASLYNNNNIFYIFYNNNNKKVKKKNSVQIGSCLCSFFFICFFLCKGIKKGFQIDYKKS